MDEREYRGVPSLEYGGGSKDPFLAELRRALAGLPQEDIEERVEFYREMIEDRMEEGVSEEEAVAAAGPIDEIVSQTVAEIPFAKIVKERVTPKRKMRAWEIVLLILGFPLWFPLLLVAGAVVLVLYIVLWSLILSLWAVELALIVSAVGTFVGGVAALIRGGALTGMMAFGATSLLVGIAIFLFFGCIAVSKGILRLTKKLALGIKHCFVRREEAQ